jgi:hypothetical protein
MSSSLYLDWFKVTLSRRLLKSIGRTEVSAVIFGGAKTGNSLECRGRTTAQTEQIKIKDLFEQLLKTEVNR